MPAFDVVLEIGKGTHKGNPYMIHSMQVVNKQNPDGLTLIGVFICNGFFEKSHEMISLLGMFQKYSAL